MDSRYTLNGNPARYKFLFTLQGGYTREKRRF